MPTESQSGSEEGSAFVHVPVLATTLAEQIILPQDAVMVDATIGQGGHSYLFGHLFGSEGVIVGFDVDEKSLKAASERLSGLSCKVLLVRENFGNIERELGKAGVGQVDFILADLGFSSAQVEDEQTGLSFQKNMLLDMRLDKRIKRTAADIVNNASESELADLIFEYGEDRASRRIARFIVEGREKQPIRTTGELAMIVCRALGRPGKKWSRMHPATRTFQALRIAVNDEMGSLERLLEQAPRVLKVGGRIAIISFHSLEDRRVKLDFKANEKAGVYEVVTKKPVVPRPEEIEANVRARSAKLRIARKVLEV